jgi:hypothetical protein
MTLVNLNADEWYPVYVVLRDPEHGRYDIDEKLLRRYEKARDVHRLLLDELDKAYEDAIDRNG